MTSLARLLRSIPGRLPVGVEPLLVLLGLSGVGVFAMLTDEMLEGDTRRVDTAILVAIRRSGDLAEPRGPHWLSQSAVDISALGGFTVLWLLALTAAGYLAIVRRRAEALLVALSIGGASLLNWALKIVVDRQRPEVVPHLVAVSNASYPSGHAMLSAVTYLTIAALLARIQQGVAARIYLLALAAVLVVLIGLSRLYLGVHWPSDVLAGWCLGAAWALGSWVAVRKGLGPR